MSLLYKVINSSGVIHIFLLKVYSGFTSYCDTKEQLSHQLKYMIHHLVDISHRLSLLELSTECVRVVDTLKECLLGALPSSDYQIGMVTL